jgi:hypothetical protein
MIVRIRFGRGRLLTRRKGKNGHAARLLASLLNLVSISFGIFCFWRLGQDLGFTGDFVFPTGFLSHWQVWMALAASTQYASWRLTRYHKSASQQFDESDEAESSNENEAESPVEKLSARV